MSNLDLTIVVPTYNLGHYLRETLALIMPLVKLWRLLTVTI